MNSLEFEKHVASLIESEINAGKHGFDPKCVLVRHHPKYYSRDRRRDITFDSAAEVTRPGENSPFLYWIIECKHYSSNVPVNDVEEFFAKLQQIGGANAKGTIVSKAGFDSGTIEFARSKGIGLWRYDPDGEQMMVVQGDGARERAIILGMIECEYGPRFFGLSTTGYLANWEMTMIDCELHAISMAIGAG